MDNDSNVPQRETKTCSIIIEVPARTTLAQLEELANKMLEDHTVISASLMIKGELKVKGKE